MPPEGGEELRFGGATLVVRVSAESTGGALSVIEELPPMLDTPRHVHANEDEAFLVLEGRHVVELGDEEFELGPGESIFLPRGIPHAQRRVVPGEGRQLVFILPGHFEGFFRELSAAEAAGGADEEVYARASRAYGLTWL
jgi:mannose-6-phosphate isomerase-like protein (cupin superfamily)